MVCQIVFRKMRNNFQSLSGAGLSLILTNFPLLLKTKQKSKNKTKQDNKTIKTQKNKTKKKPKTKKGYNLIEFNNFLLFFVTFIFGYFSFVKIDNGFPSIVVIYNFSLK